MLLTAQFSWVGYMYICDFFLDDMKTNHVKNTGENWKITRGGGQRGQIVRGGGKLSGEGAKGGKSCTGGALPFFPHSYSPPLNVVLAHPNTFVECVLLLRHLT